MVKYTNFGSFIYIKIMNRYTIYCTETQVKKALELGAPIKTIKKPRYSIGLIEKVTSEQMIGWFEEQGVMFNIAVNPFDDYKVIITKASSYETIANIKWNHNRKNAIIAGIDAALDYLENLKQ